MSLKIKFTIQISAFALFIIFVFTSCEKGENETKISEHSSLESHKTGENCMNCHHDGGSGEGWFTVAGTLYAPDKTNISPNGTVKIYSISNSTKFPEMQIEVDGKGNYYTTEQVDFSNDLYVEVISSNGNSKAMISKLQSGDCNSCHGNSTDVVWAK